MAKKQLTGIVVSNKMQKTVVVEVEKLKRHPKYKRIYKVHKKYKAHDEKGECKVGDKVIIEECRPISKEKRWRVIKRVNE
jgi:small subunit ribosomal protein S17